MIYCEDYIMEAANMGMENPLADIYNIEYIHATHQITEQVTEEERQYMGLFIHVKDKNGQPILWEDGYADDFGDWMIVTIGYGTSR